MEQEAISEHPHGAQEIMAKLVDPIVASEYLKTTVQTMAGWRIKGTGPRFRKYGRRVRYSLEDLDAFLKEKTFTSTSEYPADNKEAATSGVRRGRPKKQPQ